MLTQILHGQNLNGFSIKMQSIPSKFRKFPYNCKYCNVVAQDITDIAILYLLTEGLRGMKFPLSTIYAMHAHMITCAYQRSNDLDNYSKLIMIS